MWILKNPSLPIVELSPLEIYPAGENRLRWEDTYPQQIFVLSGGQVFLPH